jgi:hypothetical protein
MSKPSLKYTRGSEIILERKISQEACPERQIRPDSSAGSVQLAQSLYAL